MEEELYIERIERYESGEMSAAERSAFESELASNQALRQTYELFLQANDVIEQGIENDLRTQLQGWSQEEAATAPFTIIKTPATKTVSMRSTWMRMAAAASVALLIGWFGWQWAGNTYSDASLYAGYYEKPGDSAFRGANAEHPLEVGFNALQADKPEIAILFFSTIPADNDYYAEAQYYLGHAALQLKQYDTAIAAFGKSAARPGSQFSEKAEWNLLLAYLAAGRSEAPEFKSLLEKTAGNSGHSYQSQARKLQESLASGWRKLAK